MNEKSWAERGLTDDVLAELYRRGRKYVAARIAPGYREDAVQDGMLQILTVVASPPDDYPTDPAKRLNYLSTVLWNHAMRFVARKTPPDTNIPIE